MAQIFWQNSSKSDACTKKRSAPMQFWPEAPQPARAATSTMASTLAPGSRMNGSLPPSSSTTG
eukprot:4507068-Prymnesium_polylepis.1